MKNTLILHGFGAKPNSNWFPWLKNELEFKADGVFLPALPNTSEPVLKEQLEYLYAYSSDFKEGGNIVGHSMGGILSMHFALENNIRNSNLVLVAPVYNNLLDDCEEGIFGPATSLVGTYFDSEVDFEKFNKLNNKVTVFLSDNDPFINVESAKKFYLNINNVEFKIFENKGHLNEGTGNFSFPEIFNYID